jgi:hypothetical protein
VSARITDLDDGEFGRLFTDFRYTAYRLETLQRYDVAHEEESFAAFLAGRPIPVGPSKDNWTSTVANGTLAGKAFRRVHVVEEPLTDYLRYELAGYWHNVSAGEDIRILPVQAGRWPDLPRRDYWLFDSRSLWFMDYDEQGRFLGAARSAEAEGVVLANHWRDSAMHAAIPYADYIRTTG